MLSPLSLDFKFDLSSSWGSMQQGLAVTLPAVRVRLSFPCSSPPWHLFPSRPVSKLFASCRKIHHQKITEPNGDARATEKGKYSPHLTCSNLAAFSALPPKVRPDYLSQNTVSESLKHLHHLLLLRGTRLNDRIQSRKSYWPTCQGLSDAHARNGK